MPCTNEMLDPTGTDACFSDEQHSPTQRISRKCRYLVNRTQPQASEIEQKVDCEGLSHVGERCPFLDSHTNRTVCPWHNK